MRRVGPPPNTVIPYDQEVNMAAQGSAHQRHHRMGPGMLGDKFTHSLRRRSNRPDRSEINPFVKYFLFFFNFLFFLLGLGMLVLGIYILVVKEKTVSNWIDFLFDPACLVLSLGGSIITFITFFGAYGSLRENICCLQVFSISMAICLLLEVLLIVLVFVFYFVDDAFADIGLYPEDALEDAVVKYRDDPDMQGLIDNIQELLSCCGVSKDDEGYKDWNKNLYFQCSDDNFSPEACSVPFSCCRISGGDQINYQCGAGMLKDNALDRERKIYTQGCLKGLENVIKDNIWIYGGVIFGVLLPQAFVICVAKALVFQVKEQMLKW
ncbi:tetraspanin-33 [Aplysia californica]|uniref:Tetraspanin-33 n=1 Tax=Aplysia californica TaxID=6500 RepID=A0ABM0JF95_APLCA|nr:tetraspanin-33 [Aplysia californica]